MTHVTNMIMVGNEDVFDDELNWFFFSEKKEHTIARFLLRRIELEKFVVRKLKC